MIRKLIFCNLIVVLLTVQQTSALSDINHCKRSGREFKVGDIYTINNCYICTCNGADIYTCDGRKCPYAGKPYCQIGGIRLSKGTRVMIGCDCKCLGDNMLSCTYAPCSIGYYIHVG